jgi:hypothetical protein
VYKNYPPTNNKIKSKNKNKNKNNIAKKEIVEKNYVGTVRFCFPILKQYRWNLE